MKMVGRVFIDANVPMYAFGKEHPYEEPCRLILHKVGIGEIPGVTSVEVLQEILHRYLSLGRTEEGIIIARQFSEIVDEVFPVELADVQKAMELARQATGTKSRDLIHVAVMLNNGIHTIISADKHFDLFPEIRRTDPMEFHTAG